MSYYSYEILRPETSKVYRSVFASVLFHALILLSASVFIKKNVSYGIATSSTQGASNHVHVEITAASPYRSEERPIEATPESVVQEIIKEEPLIQVKKQVKKNQEKNQPRQNVETALQNTAENSQTNVKNSGEGSEDNTNTSGSKEKVTDVRAAYLRNPPPPYPHQSRVSGEQGLVLLLVSISASGKVEDVSIKSSSGYQRLDRAAVNAVSEWEFKASTILGMPVSDEVEVPIRFELAER